jgi:hypothetical protein
VETFEQQTKINPAPSPKLDNPQLSGSATAPSLLALFPRNGNDWPVQLIDEDRIFPLMDVHVWSLGDSTSGAGHQNGKQPPQEKGGSAWPVENYSGIKPNAIPGSAWNCSASSRNRRSLSSRNPVRVHPGFLNYEARSGCNLQAAYSTRKVK